MPKASLIDAVRERIDADPIRPGPKHWLVKLPTDAREELLHLRAQFLAGNFGRSSAMEVARRTHAIAAERGWAFPSIKEFALWLRRN